MIVMSHRLRLVTDFPVPAHLRNALCQAGLKTVEDILRWRKSSIPIEGIEMAGLRRIDKQLSAMGLFCAEPISERNLQIYLARRDGATFASLAASHHLAPEAARIAYYRVRAILDAEAKLQEKIDAASFAVRDLPLPTRAKFGLQRARIFTVQELLLVTEQELLRIRGLGMGSIQAIKTVQSRFQATEARG